VEAANCKIDESFWMSNDRKYIGEQYCFFVFGMQLSLDASDCMKNLTMVKKALEMDQSRMGFKMV